MKKSFFNHLSIIGTYTHIKIMSFADQLRSFYVSKQPSANSTYNTNIIFAGVYDTVRRECVRQASAALPAGMPPTVIDRGVFILIQIYVYGDLVTDGAIQYVMINRTIPAMGWPTSITTFWIPYIPTPPPVRSFTLDVTATTSAVASVTALPTPSQGGTRIVWRGAWNSSTTYGINATTGAIDAVTYQGVSYVATQGSGPLPPLVPSTPPTGVAWYVPAVSDPIYPFVPQTGTYVAAPQDLLVIRAELIKRLTTTDIGLTVTPSGPLNLTISW